MKEVLIEILISLKLEGDSVSSFQKKHVIQILLLVAGLEKNRSIDESTWEARGCAVLYILSRSKRQRKSVQSSDNYDVATPLAQSRVLFTLFFCLWGGIGEILTFHVNFPHN